MMSVFEKMLLALRNMDGKLFNSRLMGLPWDF
jgi:hypothetical protein